MLKDILEKYDVFTTEELEKIIPLFKHKKLSKGEYFIKSGEYSKNLAIVESGILRSYFLENGEELTYCFRFPEQPLASYSSFTNGIKSEKAIQALTDVELWSISKENTDRVTLEYPNWERFLKIIIEKEYSSLEKQRFEMLSKTPAEQYQIIEQEYPHYLKWIPLQYIASFIGISQRHLSRIRSF